MTGQPKTEVYLTLRFPNIEVTNIEVTNIEVTNTEVTTTAGMPLYGHTSAGMPLYGTPHRVNLNVVNLIG